MKKFNQGYNILFVDDDRIFGKLFIKWYGKNTNYDVAHIFDAINLLPNPEHKFIPWYAT